VNRIDWHDVVIEYQTRAGQARTAKAKRLSVYPKRKGITLTEARSRQIQDDIEKKKAFRVRPPGGAGWRGWALSSI